MTDTDHTQPHSTADHTQPQTAAVPFNPFDDDDDTFNTAAVPFNPFDDDDDDDPLPDPSARSRTEALNTFRSRRSTTREGRSVANGMVRLPFVPIKETGLMDPATTNLKPPLLKEGDIVANQYKILGVVAHGGMGWIYLAQDQNVSGRVVVLKGLIGSGNPHDIGAAIAEREFLADITHPVIVKAYNFIDDPRVAAGFIVMEYVPGPSLRKRRQEQPGGVFAIDIAIGYILETLPALEYLHARGVVYNDFKPDNIIVTEDQVKLIDLGAVTGIGAFGYIFGTKGFQAPEVSTEGPSVASDIYTVGRTLAAMTINMPKKDGAYAPGLPGPDEEPLFAQYLSYYRLLRRATDPDPKQRFSTVQELTTQLYGVLREYLAVHDGRQFPAQHSLFSPQRSTFGTKHIVFKTDQLIDGIERSVRITPPEVVAALHVPLLDRNDPGAAMIAGSSYTEPSEALETMREAMAREKFAQSKEIPLGIIRSLLDLGFTTESKDWLKKLESSLGDDWRYQWYSGITSLLLDDFLPAQDAFNKVFNILPGEAAPKLARAAVCELILQSKGMDSKPLLQPATAIEVASLKGEIVNELAGLWTHLTQDPAVLRYKAIYLYSLVWATNPATVSSGFGLARQLMAERQVDVAVQALDKVPASSMHRRMAELTSVLYLVSDMPNEQRIRRAARRLEEIPTNEPRFLQVQIAVLNAALHWLRSEGLEASASRNDLFDYPFTQLGLRRGLERALRLQARSAPTAAHRYQLVDTSNKIRPRTWF